MADENQPVTVPPAQGEQVAAQTPVQQPVEAPQGSPGAEARIQELVAQMHETRRQAEAVQEQNRQLMLAMMQNQQTAQRPPDPYAGVEVDPDDRRRVEAVMAPMIRQMQETQRQMAEQVSRNQARQHAERAYGSPIVADLADKFAGEWQRKGLTGWTPEDAATYALGVAVDMERRKGGKGGATPPAPNFTAPKSPPLITQSSAPSAPSRRPHNFDQLPEAKQLQILEDEIGDLPL